MSDEPKVVSLHGASVDAPANAQAIDVVNDLAKLLRNRPDVTEVMIVTYSPTAGVNTHNTLLSDLTLSIGMLDFLKMRLFVEATK